MPRLRVATERRRVSGRGGVEYTLVRLEGFIDAPNFLEFDQCLDKLARADEARVVLNFRRVQYINSTGISSIIRHHSTLAAKSGALVLIQVPRTVGLTMHLLGLTSIVPFLKDLQQAERLLVDRDTGAGARAEFLPAADNGPREIPVLVDSEAGSGGCVVVAVPREGPFTEILRSRLARLNGKYHLAHSTDEILRRLDDWDPDLVVLDHRLTGSDRFIETLKVETNASLTSILMLYGKHSDVTQLGDFRVWENDYLVDPFDLMNLFRLTESELRRVPRDKKLFTQQVHFQFSSHRPAVERGMQLANQLLSKLRLEDSENTALYAAFKEAMDNAVLHGNHNDPEKRVDVNFLVDPHKVTFIVEDCGEGFDYEFFLSKISSHEAFEKAKQRIRAGGRGGLGILLMHRCSDRLEYSGKGNIVRIEKNLA